ncbi:heavy metal-binding domain-containing protein [Shewanella benthica]
MNLTAVTSASNSQSCNNCPHHKASAHEQGMSADTHACPMNAEITGKEGDTCPKCGMNLEPMQAKADTKPAVHHKH